MHWTVIFTFSSIPISPHTLLLFSPPRFNHDQNRSYLRRLAVVEGCTAVEDFAAVEGFTAVEGFVAVEDCCRRGDLFISLGFHFASSFFSNSIILIFWDEPAIRDLFVNSLKPSWERNHGIKGTLHTQFLIFSQSANSGC